MAGPKSENDVRLEVEFDGGIEQDSVDTLALVAFAHAYFQLLEMTATEVLEVDEALAFRGLYVEAKCVRIAAMPTNPEVAQESAERTLRYLSGEEPVPYRLHKLRDEVAAARQRTAAHDCMVIVGPWQQRMVVGDAAIAETPTTTSVSRTAMRATVIRVGGQRPVVRLRARGVDGSFSASVTREQARVLGARLYENVDVVLRLERDGDGRVVGGRVEELFLIDATDPEAAIAAWRAYHREVGAEWDDVEDIEGELGRDK